MTALSREQVEEQLENIHLGSVEVRLKSMACIKKHDAALRARVAELEALLEQQRTATYQAVEREHTEKRRIAELKGALKVTTKWMEWWLGLRECECDNGHTCGFDERKKELAQAQQALKAEK